MKLSGNAHFLDRFQESVEKITIPVQECEKPTTKSLFPNGFRKTGRENWISRIAFNGSSQTDALPAQRLWLGCVAWSFALRNTTAQDARQRWSEQLLL